MDHQITQIMKTTTKVIFITFLSFFLCQCDSKNTRKPDPVEEANQAKAMALYEEAFNLSITPFPQRDSLVQAIVLLDSAILFDPTDKWLYFLKNHCQTSLGEYKEALQTVRKMEELLPGSADTKYTVGIAYYLNDDPASGQVKFREADSLWNLALDTVSPQNEMVLLHILINKASVLKCLGEEEEASKVLKRLLEEPVLDKYEEMLQNIDSLFNSRSEEGYLEYLLSEIKKNRI